VQHSLTRGSMRAHSDGLSQADLGALLAFVSSTSASVSTANQCTGKIRGHEKILWNGWGNGTDNARRQTASGASITSANASALRLKWAFGFAGAVRSRSQPLITEGRLYVGSQSGRVHALDLHTGCEWWHFDAEAEVRGALAADNSGASLFFADFSGNVYRVDALTGALAWKRNVAEHETATITGSMTLHRNRLFVPISSTEVVSAISPDYECCTFRGAVAAIDIETGALAWRAYSVPQPERRGTNSSGARQWGPSGAPVWSTPTVDERRDLIYFGTGQNYSLPATGTSDAVIAVSRESGEVAWVRQTLASDVWNAGCVTNGVNCPEPRGPDFDIGTAPILAATASGKDIILVGQKSGMVYALDPDANGDVVWQRRVGRGGKKGGVHWGMTTDGETLFVPIADLPDDSDTGYEAQPGLHALDLSNGRPRWYLPADPICSDEGFACVASFSAAASSVNDVVLLGAMNGQLSAVDATDGEILWSFDTARPFETVNELKANGGSIDVAGPIAVDRYVVVQSGYDLYGQLTGNALLVFELEE
ncbi:MAG: PQQ-binding-like beta-propeller repeat protein, partial [Pseudomonadota bacterium]